MKVLIAGGGTGGHLMPALALADAFHAAGSEPVLVGAQRGVEASILPTRPYRHHLLPLEPIYRGQWWKNIRWPLIAWRVMRTCRDVLDRERPDLVVGTGGYASGPLLFAASSRNIPIALQEQNAFPGVTTRWLAGRAAQIHLGFPEAAGKLKPGRDTRVFTLGNPIAVPQTGAGPRAAARAELGIEHDALVLLVTGGSQGSRAMNQALGEAILHVLLDDIWILWSTGPAHFAKYSGLHTPPRRQVRAFWDPIGTAYAAADLVVARAGAMTTAELCAYGLPSILVPFPHAAADHQMWNARALEQAGAAVVLPEDQLTAESLAKAVLDVLGDETRRGGMADAARERGRPDAAAQIVKALTGGAG